METTGLSHAAEEHLRTIRSLMERATVYRAISAGPAGLAGVLAVGLGLAFWFRSGDVSPGGFVGAWLAVLALVGGGNTWMLFREARRRGAAFPSPATLHGVRTLLPALLAGGVLGLVYGWSRGELVVAALWWTTAYGLALLATAGFAPRSIRALGWAFLVAGLAGFCGREGGLWQGEPGREAGRIMAATFGGFHLVYAFRTGWWKRGREG